MHFFKLVWLLFLLVLLLFLTRCYVESANVRYMHQTFVGRGLDHFESVEIIKQ